MAGTWRGRAVGRLAGAGLGLLALIAADFGESVAEAGFLKQGLRPGERGRVELLRPPPPGVRQRVRPPIRQPAAPPAERAAAAPDAGAAAPHGQQHSWFWDIHQPALQTAPGLTDAVAGAGAAARWTEALATTRTRRAHGLGVFRAGDLARIRALYGPQIDRAARRHDVSAALLLAVIAVESRGRAGAVSPRGAQGLMQLIPATAQRFGVSDAFEPAANIDGGAAYLDWLLGEFGGDILLALAGYNAGENAVRRHRGVPPYAETRAYVPLVLDAVAAAQALCHAPPEGPRLPCRWKAGAG